MAKILNYGSINIDHVYQMDHFVRPGETTASLGLEYFPGGKGMNQSIALARAGADVYHAGKIGSDGLHLLKLLEEAGANVQHIRTDGSVTGQAIIQVDRSGQNCILLHHGANYELKQEEMEQVFAGFERGDVLLLQNEVNGIGEMIELAHARGMDIAINPSPIGPEIQACDLGKVTWFLMNEIEGETLSGKSAPEEILDEMERLYPSGKFVLTVGKNGVLYRESGRTYRHGIYQVPVADTTAAGDTFTGFFLAAITRGADADAALAEASVASSIAVSRKGAAVSIPTLGEVQSANLQPL